MRGPDLQEQQVLGRDLQEDLGNLLRARRSGPGGDGREVVLDGRDDGCPVAGGCLPVEAGAGIPRAIGSVHEPSPVGDAAQENPHRSRQGTGKVGNAGVDGDDEVQHVA